MKYLNKIIADGLYLLVFLLPIETRWIIKAGQLNYGPWEYGTYSLYLTDILFLIILALFIVYEIVSLRLSGAGDGNSVSGQKSPCRNGRIIWWLIGGLVLASAVSVFSASDKLLALYKFGWLISGVGLFWLVTSANYDRLKLIYAMLAGAFISAGLGIWQFLNQATFANKWLGLALHRGADLGVAVIETVGADGIGERWLRAYGGLDHPNMLGGMLVIGIFLLIGQIVVRERIDNFQIIFNDKIFKFLNWSLVLVFAAALFFSFSRSAWLALASGLAVLAVLAVARGNLKLQKGLAEIILVMGILSLVLFSQYQNLVVARLAGEGRLEAKANSERLASYQESWQLIKNHWLFGVGPGNYTLALSRETPERASYFYQPAHNVFLLAFSEIGIFGLMFFIGLIIFAFVRLPRRPSASWRNEALRHDSQTAILIALIILMLFDHWLFSLHFGGWFFWLALGLIYEKKLPNN